MKYLIFKSLKKKDKLNKYIMNHKKYKKLKI